MLVFSHNSRFVRGDLPKKPIRSHTERGTYGLEAGKASIWREVPVIGGIHRWMGGCCQSQGRWLQWWHTSSGVEVQQGSECDPWYSKLEHWVGGALSFYNAQGVEVPLILVSRWSPYLSVQPRGLGIPGST